MIVFPVSFTLFVTNELRQKIFILVDLQTAVALKPVDQRSLKSPLFLKTFHFCREDNCTDFQTHKDSNTATVVSSARFLNNFNEDFQVYF